MLRRCVDTFGPKSILLWLTVAVASAAILGEAAASQSAQSANSQGVLAGTIDIHTHSEPDSTRRIIDVIDLAKLARSRGMRGIVLKDHYQTTASLAYIVRKEVPGVEVFGGITMDRTNGGVNPSAVENMAKVTGGFGRIVWMPTFDSEAAARSSTSNQNRPFVSVSRNGELLPEVKEVISIIAKNGLVLATGHSSAEEDLMLVREGRRQGAQHMVITHAVSSPTRMSVPQMQQAAETGAFVEFCYLGLIGQRPQFTAKDYANAIRAIGPNGVILSTDLGQPGNPVQPDGLAAFIMAMRAEGFTQKELDQMTKDNPARLLALPPL
jgi:hypothetical protein